MRNLNKAVLSKVLYLFYILINLITVKKERQIAFISFPGATDNSWYLYKYISENYEGFHLIWLLDNLSSKEFAYKKINSIHGSNKVSIINKWSLKGIFYFCTSKTVFHTHGTYSFVGKVINSPTIVNLWHGMPIKAIGHLDKNNKNVCYSDYVISTSEYYQSLMSKVFNIHISRVLNCGLPRNDVLKKKMKENEKTEIIKKLKISSSDDILMWLPTYRQSNIGDIRKDSLSSSFIDELPQDFLESLDFECGIKNTKIIIKLHPMDCLNIDVIEKSYKNIIFLDSNKFESLSIQLYDLLSISKALISDVSSVMIDCLTSDISIGIIESSHQAYTRDFVINLGDLLKDVSLINKPSQVLELMKMRNFNHSIFNDGHTDACLRIAEYFLGQTNKTEVI